MAQPTPRYYGITDFSPGMNAEFDPRSLRPYTNEDGSMEAERIENYDITQLGALVVAPGYEEVVSLGTGVPTKLCENYEATPDRRYLIGVSNDQVFYLRKYTNAIVHDCDSHTSGTYGTFAVTGDATSLATETSDHVRGDGCLTASIATGGGLTGTSKFTVASLTSVDLTDYTHLEFFINFSNVNDTGGSLGMDEVKIRYGSSSTDYNEVLMLRNQNNGRYPTGWNAFRATMSQATATGTPDITAITFLEIELTYDADYDGGTILIDDIRATADATAYQPVEVTTSALWTETYDSNSIVNAVNFKGSSSLNHFIIGNSNQSPMKLTSLGDGMVIAQDLTSMPDNSYIMCTAVGFLFMAEGKTVHYSASEDETTEDGTIGFNADVTGLAPTVDKTVNVTLDTVDTQEISFSFNDTSLIYTPVRGEYRAGVGGVSHKSIKSRYNDELFLGTEGIAYFGEQEQYASGNYRVTSRSWKIDRLIRSMNDGRGQHAAGYYSRNKKEYGVALPIGPQAVTNNALFIWKAQYDSWLYRSGINMSHATEYRESDDYDLFFGDAQTDSIHKFVDDYSYNGDSYVRRYVTKVFNMGVPLLHKRVNFIDIGGAMPKGCEFYVVAYVDGVQKIFKIDDTALIVNSQSGGYIGDDYYGNDFFGGLVPNPGGYEFFRFYQRIELPADIVEGMEFQFEFYYEGTGRPHKIDLFGMRYTIDPEGKVPSRHINNNIATDVTIT